MDVKPGFVKEPDEVIGDPVHLDRVVVALFNHVSREDDASPRCGLLVREVLVLCDSADRCPAHVDVLGCKDLLRFLEGDRRGLSEDLFHPRLILLVANRLPPFGH